MNSSTLVAALAAVLLLALAALGIGIMHPGGIRGLFGVRAAPEVYACPMVEDTEIRSDGPGKCPKCGMDLVPISRTEHKGEKPAEAGECQGAGADRRIRKCRESRRLDGPLRYEITAGSSPRDTRRS